MSIASSRVSCSPLSSNLSCTFLCLVPTMSCSISRSSDSALSLNLHFVAWFRQRVKKMSTSSSCFCLSCCNWYLANLWFTFGTTCFSNRSQIFAGFALSSAFSQVQLLYVSNRCLPIHNKMNEACSFADFLEYGPLKIRSQYCLNFANSSRKSDASQFMSGVLNPALAAMFAHSVC